MNINSYVRFIRFSKSLATDFVGLAYF
jgi:hypothetical protein